MCKGISIHSKNDIYRHNLKGRSARKKPLLQNHHKKARLWFATANWEKWKNVLWSDETKMAMFGGKRGGLQAVLWGCFAAGGTGALHKIDGIMRKINCGYIEATFQDISQEVKA